MTRSSTATSRLLAAIRILPAALLLAGAGMVGAPLLPGVMATPVAMAQESDMDGDGLFDEEESLQFGTSPFLADTDGDLLDDRQEIALGTDPRDAASPGPGFDIDGDGLTDADEVNIHGTDMNSPDSDQDGASDGFEVSAGTNPLVAQEFDTDGDGLTDRQETFTYLTDELKFDTDGDGIGDGREISLGLDPHTFNSPDPVGPSPVKTAPTDSDGDGLSDFDETSIWGTNPNDSNTDGDYYNDGFEASQVGLDPLNPDTDSDGMLDGCDTDDTIPETDPDVGIVCQG